MKLNLCVLTFVIAFTAATQSTSSGQTSNASLVLPKFDRRPAVGEFTKFRGKLQKLPVFDPASNDPYQVNLCAADLTDLDLRGSTKDLFYATFDTRTRWPVPDRLTPDFNYGRIIELGRNPGLGVRSLHARGITGRGVGIAIVDQPLLIEHEEFGNRIRLYEEFNVPSDSPAQMHGLATASIAAGKTVGVAPEADIYFIATYAFDANAKVRSRDRTRDFRWYTQAVRRVLEINEQLPVNRKIRVISLSVGWDKAEAGYDEMERVVKAARDAGLLVTSSNFRENYKQPINGLGRMPLADPEFFDSYSPGMFWVKYGINSRQPENALLIPMDSRTTAAPNGAKDYAFYRQAGFSWITPYLAGVYALAVQTKPDVTPDEFIKIAFETGRAMKSPGEKGDRKLGVILNPVALIDALKAK